MVSKNKKYVKDEEGYTSLDDIDDEEGYTSLDNIEEVDTEPSPYLAIPRAVGQAILPVGDELVGGIQAGSEAIGNFSEGKGLGSLNDLVNSYKKHRDVERQKVKKSYDQNPIQSYGTEIATALVPGLAATKLGKGSSILRALDKLVNPNVDSGAMGAVNAMAGSEKEMDDPEISKDILEGAAIGKATGAVGDLARKGVGKVVKSEHALPKLGEIMFDVPKEQSAKYMEKGPGYLDDVLSQHEQVKRYQEKVLPYLKGDVIDKSRMSKEALGLESDIPSSDISDIFNKHINQRKEQIQGISGVRPSIDAAINRMESIKSQFEPKKVSTGILDSTGKPLTRIEGEELNPSIIKELLRGLDENITYTDKSGQIMKADDAALKELRGDVNQYARDLSPEFSKIMDELQVKAPLLKESQKLGSTENVFANVLKKVGGEKEGSETARNILLAIEKEIGPEELAKMNIGSLVEDAEKLSLEREFGKNRTAGSKQTKKWSEWSKGLFPKDSLWGNIMGGIMGTVADKYGGAIVRNAIDAVAKSPDMSKHGRIENNISKQLIRNFMNNKREEEK